MSAVQESTSQFVVMIILRKWNSKNCFHVSFLSSIISKNFLVKRKYKIIDRIVVSVMLWRLNIVSRQFSSSRLSNNFDIVFIIPMHVLYFLCVAWITRSAPYWVTEITLAPRRWLFVLLNCSQVLRFFHQGHIEAPEQFQK